LLEQSVEGATGILLNITGGSELGLFEVNEAAEIVQSAADQGSNIIFGAVIDESLGDEVRVVVIATGFDAAPSPGRLSFSRPQRAAREESAPRRTDSTRERDFSMGEGERSSLEVPDEEIDIPSFLKDR
jgi:cell division protein FtsZ